MKIVQTFWSGTQNTNTPLHLNGGWAHPEYNWMSWALSALLLKRQYDRLELYTDAIGKKILVDLLKLPYTKVHIVFDKTFTIHPKLFALAKIKTYSLQEEPFIHIDGDLFLWHPLSENTMNAGLIASNPEMDLFFNKAILKEMEEHFPYIPKHLRNVYRQEHIFSSNAGIFGGSNIPFIRKYCSMGRQIVRENKNSLKKVTVGLVNMLIEQISLHYLAAQENIEIKYCVSTPVDHPLYKDFWRFADIPEVPMIHPVAGCKRIPYVLHHLSHRLYMESPTLYYRVLKYCLSEDMLFKNRLYNYLDFKNGDDSKNLHQADSFKKAVDLSGLKTLIPDSNAFYYRTFLAIKHYYPTQEIKEKELKSFVHRERSNKLVKEIFSLEEQRRKCFEKLWQEIVDGEIYNADFEQYESTTNFNRDANWIQRKVALKDGTFVVKVSRPWGPLDTAEPQKDLAEILETTEKAYCAVLTMDLLAFEVQERYYTDLDAMVITHIQDTILVEDLLVSLITHFEEEIAIDNPKYQLLIFDILKRLAFENVLSIF